ncbi:zinc transporter ZntB [Teredinibacter turnerae]|uniref:zinc transporter ZntB n=1 Tax=Teredinibacter turnerae TaxID=2426 RepID=UPI00035F25C4|nr:zinc transporter ZntB [Teredinibacter turnerae]
MITEQTFSHALLLDGNGGARHLTSAEVDLWRKDQGILWLHMNFEEPAALVWLAEEAGISQLAYEGLVSENTRPRVISRGEKLLMTLRGVNTNPGEDPEDMVSIRVWTDGTRIITTYRRRLLSTIDIINSLEEGAGPTSAAEFLLQLNERLVERMNDTVEQLEEKMLELEELVLSGDTDGVRRQLSSVRLQGVVLRRYFAPQREAMNRLVFDRMPWLDDNIALILRDINDRLIRHIEDLDAIRERASVVQEELVNSMSDAMNQRTYVLTVAAAIFLPLGFFTGLMGINVGGMPGVEDPNAFWVVTGMSLLTIIILAFVFRMKKWL